MYQYDFNWGVLWRYRPLIWEGLLTAFEVALIGLAIGCFVGLLAAFAQVYGRRPLRMLSIVYVEFFRNIPLLLIMFFLYFGLPLLGVRWINEKWSAIIGLGIYAGAYLTEVFRAGILAIPRGQIEAGQSLGLTSPQVGLYVMLPQMLRVVLPALANAFVSLYKDTSLAAAIAVHELTWVGMRINTDTWRIVETWTVIGGIYLITSYALTIGLRQMERLFARWS